MTIEDFLWNQLSDEEVCQKFVDAAEELFAVRDRLRVRGIEVQDVDMEELLTTGGFCMAGNPTRKTLLLSAKFAKLICPSGRR
jgi:hypothetical protein